MKKDGIITADALKQGYVAKANVDQFNKVFPKGVVLDMDGVRKLHENELTWALTIMLSPGKRDAFVAREKTASETRSSMKEAAWNLFTTEETRIHKQLAEAKAKAKADLDSAKAAAKKAYADSVASAFFDALDD